jgi:hypothetical protein
MSYRRLPVTLKLIGFWGILEVEGAGCFVVGRTRRTCRTVDPKGELRTLFSYSGIYFGGTCVIA